MGAAAPRAGRWICLGVLGFLVVQPLVVFLVIYLRTDAGSRQLWPGLSTVAVSIMVAAKLHSWIRQRPRLFRWVGVGYFMLNGVGLIGTASWWMFEGAGGQYQTRPEWPWMAAAGLLNVLVGCLLLLPQVGSYLSEHKAADTAGVTRVESA